jgi:hypothetical protein
MLSLALLRQRFFTPLQGYNLAKIRSICDLEISPWESFNPIQALIDKNAWFVFSYSLKYKSLVKIV